MEDILSGNWEFPSKYEKYSNLALGSQPERIYGKYLFPPQKMENGLIWQQKITLLQGGRSCAKGEKQCFLGKKCIVTWWVLQIILS